VKGDAEAVCARAGKLGLLVGASGPRRIRAVTNLDVDGRGIAEAARLLAQALEGG
jgi:threonine aldolase